MNTLYILRPKVIGKSLLGRAKVINVMNLSSVSGAGTANKIYKSQVFLIYTQGRTAKFIKDGAQD